MAPSRKPGPIGLGDVFPMNLAKGWGGTPTFSHPPGPIGCATNPTKNPSPIKAIIFHIYMDIGQNPNDFTEWFSMSRADEPKSWPVPIQLNLRLSSAVNDFETSLNTDGAIVVFIGHSVLLPGPTKEQLGHSRGLLPYPPHSENSNPLIPGEKLRTLLQMSKASLVIIASCDAMTSVLGTPDDADRDTKRVLGPPKIRWLEDILYNLIGGPPVFAMYSGKNNVTQGEWMANAVAALLFSLVGAAQDLLRNPTMQRPCGNATLGEALMAANEMLSRLKKFSADYQGKDTAALHNADDMFVLAHGAASMRLFP